MFECLPFGAVFWKWCWFKRYGERHEIDHTDFGFQHRHFEKEKRRHFEVILRRLEISIKNNFSVGEATTFV